MSTRDALVVSNPLDIVALNRARTTFQRTSDAHFFNGWVKHIDLDKVVVHTCTNIELHVGEEFLFQVYGNRKEAIFRAKTSQLNGAEHGPIFMCDRNVNGTAVELSCTISSAMTLKDANGYPRFCMDGASADLAVEGGQRIEGSVVIDVGPKGFAAVTTREFRKGDRVAVVLYARGQWVKFWAVVRNCAVNPVDPETQRTGMQIAEMDRIDSMRWKQMYKEILEENRLQAQSKTAEIGKVAKLISRRAA